MEPLFEILAILQIAAGVYLLWQGIQWLRYLRRRMRTDPGFYAPRTAVICPCRGLEAGLERNLLCLCEFSHQNYEIFFVLASDRDPAYGIVKRVADSSRVPAHIVIAGPPENSSEKVNNLRTVVEQLPPEFEVLVFADSDGSPGRSWLHHLVAPLADSRIAATTTMRWLIPKDNKFPSALLAAWNASLVTLLSEQGKNFCWGGGTAIRRALFDQMGMLEVWQHAFSDDYSLTKTIEHTGRPIMFIPECLTPSYVAADFANLMEFTNRQVKITRFYRPGMWLAAFATHALYGVTVLLGLILALRLTLESRPALQVLTLLVLALLLAAIRSALRVVGATEVLSSTRSQIMAQSWVYIIVPLLVPFLYLTNFTCSLFGRRLRWRGIEYELVSRDQTRIVSR